MIMFGLIALIFIFTTTVNIIERPEGLGIAIIFIIAIVVTSLISRVYRATELRVNEVVLDETAEDPPRAHLHEVGDPETRERLDALHPAHRVSDLLDEQRHHEIRVCFPKPGAVAIRKPLQEFARLPVVHVQRLVGRGDECRERPARLQRFGRMQRSLPLRKPAMPFETL